MPFSTHQSREVEYDLRGILSLQYKLLLRMLEIRTNDTKDDYKNIFIFGGAIRDALNKEKPKDIDVRMTRDVFNRFNECAKFFSGTFPGWKYTTEIDPEMQNHDYAFARLEIPGIIPFDISIGNNISPDMTVNDLCLTGSLSKPQVGSARRNVSNSLENSLSDIMQKKIRNYPLPDNFYPHAKRVSRVQKMLLRGYTLAENDLLEDKFLPFHEDERCPVCQSSETEDGEQLIRACGNCNAPYHMSCIEKLKEHNQKKRSYSLLKCCHCQK